VLAIIGKIGTAGGTGYTIEFGGSAIRALSMEGRMTVCNMAIEGRRARRAWWPWTTRPSNTSKAAAGPRHRRHRQIRGREWDQAVAYWKTLHSDAGAQFDTVVELDAAEIVPQVTWGTSPEMVLGIDARVPDPDKEKDANKRGAIERALTYMGPAARQAINDITIDKVFIGSAPTAASKTCAKPPPWSRSWAARWPATSSWPWWCPAPGLVKEQAEREGLDEIFTAAGFEWREPGCSMCLAMNADRLEPGERCASTSNRNFEGRQGAGGRTHLVSPAMAAAAAVHGHFCRHPPLRLKGFRP
jgi:3-isopropylmalate/(R)-2-methylmalate dehydratase large subunit